MPVDGTLIFDTEIDRSGIEKGSKLAKSDLEKLGTQAKDIFSSKNLTSGLADLGGKLVGAFAFAKLAQGLGRVTTAAIKYNAQMEAYQTNFSVMLGDEAKGVEYVAQLREKAAKTPFGMEDLASAAQTMLSFGMDAENANTAMDRLGDIALGNKDKFQSLSLAFSQISAAGKLTGEDLLQMVNAGFNPLNTLAEKTGTTLEEHWAYWSRYIFCNRYLDAPKPVYQELLSLVQDKDYFVLTTNVDHQFHKAGFDKHRLFYTQGD